MKNQILVVKINDSLLGFFIENCMEIQNSMQIQGLPFLKKYFIGLSNFRGEIKLVLDLMQLLNQVETQKQASNCLLRIQENKEDMAILINQIIDVIEVTDSNFLDPKKYLSAEESEYISHIIENEEGLIRVIQVQKLFAL